MEWIKIKAQHILFSNLTNSQVGALIKCQLICAQMEAIPDREILSRLVGSKSLAGLEENLRRSSVDLFHVLKKVLEDVQEVAKFRESSKLKMQYWRELRRNKDKHVTSNVTSNVTNHVTDKSRVEKSRVEYLKYPDQENRHPILNPVFEEKKEPEILPDFEPQNPDQNKQNFSELVNGLAKKLGPPKPTNPKQVDLKNICVKNGSQELAESAKHKIHNKLIHLFEIRGWNPKLIKSVMQSCADSIAGIELKGQLFPYYEKAITQYINQNSETINAQNKKAGA